jgi:steroid 5-alpha reductase family enzyme
MSWGPLFVNLAVSLGVVVALMLCTFAYAMRTGIQVIMDTMWSFGFVVIAGATYGLSSGHGNPTIRLVVLVVTAIWGLRLAIHIFVRNNGKGEDPRYASLLRRNQGSVAKFVLRYIYYAQGRIMWIVSIPVQVAMYERHPVSALIWIGVAVWLIGFGFETIGDWQLRRFKANPANAGKVMDQGLWRYTRHPNYFGDSVVWFGLFLIACANWVGIITIFSPVIMTNLLVNHTGKALLEKHMGRSKGDDYAAYVAHTSGFFPLPPRAYTGLTLRRHY